MGYRQKWLEKIRASLAEANEKAATRAADIAVSLSEKADEEDAFELTKGFMEIVEFIPGIVLLAGNLAVDERVPIAEKIKIGVLAAYLILPTDLVLMQLVGPLAFMGDVVVIAYLLFSICSLIARLDDDVLRDNWVGKPGQVDKLAEAARAVSGMSGTQRFIQSTQQQF